MRAVDGVDFNLQRGVNASDPVTASDVATKRYTDLFGAGRMRYVGTWSSSSAYAVNDVVITGGYAYVCTHAVAQTNGLNSAPDTSSGASFWDPLASDPTASTAQPKILLTITAGTPGWRNFPSQAPLAVSKSRDGLVTLEGYVQPAAAATVAGTSYILAVLPVGTRPVDNQYFPSFAYPTSTTTAATGCRISVDVSGNLRVFTPVPIPALAGVTVTGSYIGQA